MKKLLISLGLLFGVCFCIRAQPISGTSGAGWSPVISNRVYTMIITYGGSIGTTNSVSISTNGTIVASVPTNLTFWPVGVGGSIMFVTNVNNEVHVTVRALAPEFTNNSYINNLNVGGDTKTANIYSRSNFTDRVVISNALQVLFTVQNGFLWVDGSGNVSDKAIGNNGEYLTIAAGDLSWTAPLWAPSNAATPQKIYGAGNATVSSNAATGIYTVNVTGAGSTNETDFFASSAFHGKLTSSDNTTGLEPDDSNGNGWVSVTTPGDISKMGFFKAGYFQGTNFYGTNAYFAVINADTLNLLRLIVDTFQLTNATALSNKIISVGGNSNLTTLVASGTGYLFNNGSDAYSWGTPAGSGSSNTTDSGFTVILNGDLRGSNTLSFTNIYGKVIQVNGVNVASTNGASLFVPTLNHPYSQWTVSGNQYFIHTNAGQLVFRHTNGTNFFFLDANMYIPNQFYYQAAQDAGGPAWKLLASYSDNVVGKVTNGVAGQIIKALNGGGVVWTNTSGISVTNISDGTITNLNLNIPLLCAGGSATIRLNMTNGCTITNLTTETGEGVNYYRLTIIAKNWSNSPALITFPTLGAASYGVRVWTNDARPIITLQTNGTKTIYEFGIAGTNIDLINAKVF